MNPTPMAPPQNPQGKKTNTVLIVVLLGGGALFLCCVVGILAAIAIPNFIKFQGRSKQAEVKMNLKSAFIAQKSQLAEKDTYAEDMSEVGFSPEMNNRYAYFFSLDGDVVQPGGSAAEPHTIHAADGRKAPVPPVEAYKAAIPADLAAEIGLEGQCPDACSITMVGVGNVDQDATMDVWSVSTKDRVIDGMPVPAGTPHQHVDDLMN